MNKILFLELNAIRRPKTHPFFTIEPKDQELIPSSVKALDLYQDWNILGIDNQNWITTGLQYMSEAIAMELVTLELCPQIESIFFCPGDEVTCCQVFRNQKHKLFYKKDAGVIFDFRLPELGMIELAINLTGKPNQCLLVSASSDREITAKNANIDFIMANEWRIHE